MSNKTRNELMALAAEFAEQRQSGNKRRFPEKLWKQAIALAQQYSVDEVGQAIKVPSAYLKRKMSLVTESDAEMTFMELRALTHELSHIVRINFELSSGHKMVIDGIDSTAIVPLLTEFLREGGLSCCQ
jgi:hypothetical protein